MGRGIAEGVQVLGSSGLGSQIQGENDVYDDDCLEPGENQVDRVGIFDPRVGEEGLELRWSERGGGELGGWEGAELGEWERVKLTLTGREWHCSSRS